MKVGDTVKIVNYGENNRQTVGRVLRFDEEWVKVKIPPTPGVYTIKINEVEVIKESD